MTASTLRASVYCLIGLLLPVYAARYVHQNAPAQLAFSTHGAKPTRYSPLADRTVPFPSALHGVPRAQQPAARGTIPAVKER